MAKEVKSETAENIGAGKDCGETENICGLIHQA